MAVLALDDGDRPVLPLDLEGAQPKEGVAILGYPQDGPYDVRAARVRSVQRLRSPDIYGDGPVLREVYSLRGLVRPGNSGGPVVAPTAAWSAWCSPPRSPTPTPATRSRPTSSPRAPPSASTNTEATDTGDCVG